MKRIKNIISLLPEIIKIGVKINKIETKKLVEYAHETNGWFSEKTDQIDKL